MLSITLKKLLGKLVSKVSKKDLNTHTKKTSTISKTPFKDYILIKSDTKSHVLDEDHLSVESLNHPAHKPFNNFNHEDLANESMDRISLEDVDAINQVLDDDLPADERISMGDLEESEIMEGDDKLINIAVNEVLDDDLELSDADKNNQNNSLSSPMSEESELEFYTGQEQAMDSESQSPDPSLRDEMTKHVKASLKDELESQELISQNLFSYEEDGEALEKGDKNSSINIQLAKNELKDIMHYLDQLFGNLPETVIKDFAHSSFYDKYNDLLDTLEL
ncbi:MAG: hypothetical protein IEMM0008_1075 [bacterium]|nr:MAG: hypothetical protein IEMM0008_1075 [bacterium]